MVRVSGVIMMMIRSSSFAMEMKESMKPEMKHEIHDYVSRLHAGKDAAFNHEYQAAHEHYFELLNAEEGK